MVIFTHIYVDTNEINKVTSLEIYTLLVYI
jgi:hypothetical protein